MGFISSSLGQIGLEMTFLGGQGSQWLVDMEFVVVNALGTGLSL